jgi:predicted GIY-YIG superfamily endonuclease
MYVIYALIDPRDNTVRYIGMTNDVYERFQQHIRCDGSSFAKNAWVMELRSANKMVIMETLEEIQSYELALVRESYWIKHYEMLQEPLVNVSKRTSPRKAKKTNLRIGRAIALNFVPPSDAPVVEFVLQPQSRTVAIPERTKKIGEQEVLIAYEKGYTSCRTLGKVLGISKDKANLLINQLRASGLIVSE